MVCSTSQSAMAAYQRLQNGAWLDPALEVIVLPAWDSPPYDRALPSGEVTASRVAGLFRSAEAPRKTRLVLTSAEAIAQRVPPPARLRDRGVRLRTGGEVELEWLIVTLEAFGYEFEDQVEERGQAARTGAGVDAFVTGLESPLRLEIGDGVLRSIRMFDVVDQRSTGDRDAVLLLPVSEAFAVPGETVRGVSTRLLPPGERATLFDYLSDAVISFENGVRERLDDWQEMVSDAFRTLGRAGETETAIEPPKNLYLTAAELNNGFNHARIEFSSGQGELIAAAELGAPPATLSAVIQQARSRASAGDAVLIGAAPHLIGPLRRRMGQERRVLAGWAKARTLTAGQTALLPFEITDTFRAAGLWLLSAPQPPAAHSTKQTVFAGDMLRIGDFVVEPEHGLARLTGLTMLEEPSGCREFLTLAFAGQKNRLVPCEDAGTVWRYASGAAPVATDHLTGDSWQRRRSEIAEDIAVVATGIVAQRQAREAATASTITPPREAFNRFTRRVPYPLTIDQRQAIEVVLADLARGRPMERLLCGDVGFGKTEVALHAATAVALAGRQVALAAPTTLLAAQHLETFRRRLAGFGFRIEPLIRSTSTPEARRTLHGIASREVHIAIGTHALASSKARFCDLGLVIMDEEQRFGERHKQALRALREGVHALTMTATPLPRSLQSGLIGLFDLSLLTTPPVARQPVRSVVVDFDRVIVRAALLRESRRGGQSFVVCPRIEDIAPMATRLSELAPELTIAQAHGKLRGEQLDRVMLEFAQGRADVLLATSIIEFRTRYSERQYDAGLAPRPVRAGRVAPVARSGWARTCSRRGLSAHRSGASHIERGAQAAEPACRVIAPRGGIRHRCRRSRSARCRRSAGRSAIRTYPSARQRAVRASFEPRASDSAW